MQVAGLTEAFWTTLTFKGTGVRWVTRKARSNGVSRVDIDGTRVALVDAYSRTTQHRVRCSIHVRCPSANTP